MNNYNNKKQLDQHDHSTKITTWESLGPMEVKDPAELASRDNTGLTRPERSRDAGTRKTTSKRPPTHTKTWIY